MTGDLAALLAHLDAAALEVIASRGLVRRAARETVEPGPHGFAVGPARVAIEAGLLARAAAAGFPKAALAAAIRCDCPAPGLCTHGVAVLLHLLAGRGPQGGPEGGPGVAPAADAFPEIADLAPARLRDWARADWWPALDLVPDQPARAQGRVAVRFPGLARPAPEVVFLPGAGLDGALYKGPPARRRRVVTAAAIALRRLRDPGWMPEPAQDDPNLVPGAFLAMAARALETAAQQAPVAPPMIEGALLALVASSRAERAPRLASGLRASAAALADLRDPAKPGDLLGALRVLAETRALVAALAARPGAPELTGARSAATPLGPLAAWVLGAHVWTTPTGARGLTALLYDPGLDRWLEAPYARAGGQDPTFRPAQAYAGTGPHGIAWKEAMGRQVTGTEARADPQGRLARDGGMHPGPDPLGWTDLLALPVCYATWQAARAGLVRPLALGLGAGLSRSWGLLRPRQVTGAPGGPLWLIDAEQDILEVDLPPGAVLEPADLRAGAFLCEARRGLDGLRLSLRSTLRPGPRGTVGIRNVTLDPATDAAPLRAPPAGAPPDTRMPPLAARLATEAQYLAERLLRRRLGPADRPAAQALAERCADLGLVSLARRVDALLAQPAPLAALRLLWVAEQVGLAAHDVAPDPTSARSRLR